MGTPTRRSRRAWGLVAVLFAAALVAALSATPAGQELERRLSVREVPANLSTRNRLHALLRRTGLVAIRPPLGAPPEPLPDGTCPPLEATAGALPPERMPSTGVAPTSALAADGPLLSLWLDDCRLDRLHRHRSEHGRAWEEVGWLSLFEGGRLRFASAVGVRMHGYASRRAPPFSYRLYFRGRYGQPRFPGHLLAASVRGDPSRIIVKRDHGAGLLPQPVWLYAESTAMAIGRRLGGVAPGIRPVRLTVNGAPPLEYTLLERLDSDYLRRNFGHAEFDRVRAKITSRDPEWRVFRDERQRLSAVAAPLAMADLADRFDIDSLITSLLVEWFAGTGDPLQDVMIRDRRGELVGGRWTWLLWDKDFSFDKHPASLRYQVGHSYFPFLLHNQSPARARMAARLTRRLLPEDPGFRQALLDRAVEALNHRLTPAFFAELATYNRAQATLHGVNDLEFVHRLEAYLHRRPDEILAEARQILGAGEPHAVQIVAPPRTLVVDGYALPAGSYRGRYPAGMTVTVEPTPEASRRFVGWRIGGAERTEVRPRLVLPVDAPLRIEALFRPPA